jgi:type II secretory pathway pseudopilin PulG
MCDGASRPVARHNGLTLVEVILVLSLLVIIGAISVPLLGGSFSRAGLHSGSDLLRGAWSKARLAAMQNGDTYVFRFEQGGSRFQLIKLNQLGMPESDELAPEEKDAEHSPADMLRKSQNRLPDGVVFAAGDVSKSSQIEATLGATADGPWSQPVLFRPDGTTSDASVVLENDRKQTIRVTLRGLTGISSSSDIANEAAP